MCFLQKSTRSFPVSNYGLITSESSTRNNLLPGEVSSPFVNFIQYHICLLKYQLLPSSYALVFNSSLITAVFSEQSSVTETGLWFLRFNQSSSLIPQNRVSVTNMQQFLSYNGQDSQISDRYENESQMHQLAEISVSK